MVFKCLLLWETIWAKVPIGVNRPKHDLCARYIEEDLNRCFDDVFPAKNLEQRRAKEISAHLKGLEPWQMSGGTCR